MSGPRPGRRPPDKTSTPESRSASSPTTDSVYGELGGPIVLILREGAEELAPERTAAIVAAMQAAGFAMERDDALVERAAWG